MGQTLSEPVTEKESAHCQNDEYAVSCCSVSIHTDYHLFLVFYPTLCITSSYLGVSHLYNE